MFATGVQTSALSHLELLTSAGEIAEEIAGLFFKTQPFCWVED